MIFYWFLDICPPYPDIPADCSSGYSFYNSPTGCVSYECNEDLPDIIAVDNAAVEDAWAAYLAGTLRDSNIDLSETAYWSSLKNAIFLSLKNMKKY